MVFGLELGMGTSGMDSKISVYKTVVPVEATPHVSTRSDNDVILFTPKSAV